MRRPRVKLSSDEEDAVYHCMTRCVNGEHLLDEVSREVLRRMMWDVAEFCGVEVITYALMPNHFHVLLKVPVKTPVSDTELLRRYRLLHPKPTTYQTNRLSVIEGWLAQNSPDGQAWRRQQLALMNDMSAFMKLLKQRFTLWFNATHGRFGTLWAERFKSILVEYDRHTLQTIAAYIDLNAVRKSLVEDPKDYRFCGYAEAVAGSKRARHGLRSISPPGTWSSVQSGYREVLYGTGGTARQKGAVIDADHVKATLAAGGQLPLATLLRCRWNYFSSGAALGSQAFIATQLARLARSTSRAPSSPPSKPARRATRAGSPRPRPPRNPSPPPQSSPPPTDWGGWFTLHPLRQRFHG